MAEIGRIAHGTVVRLMPYGALVRLEDGSTGLVHISEIDDSFVRNVADHLEVGSRVLIKVLAHKEGGKLEFSLKQARGAKVEATFKDEGEWQGSGTIEMEPAPLTGPDEDRVLPAPRRESRAAFDDKLREFLNDSTERLDDVRRHQDAKLGRRGR